MLKTAFMEPACALRTMFLLALSVIWMPSHGVNLFRDHGIRIEQRVGLDMSSQMTAHVVPVNFGASQVGPSAERDAKHDVGDFPLVSAQNWGEGVKDRLDILSGAKAGQFTNDMVQKIGLRLLALQKRNKFANATFVFHQIVQPSKKTKSGIFSGSRLFGLRELFWSQDLVPEPPGPPMYVTMSWSVSVRLQDGKIFSTLPTISEPQPSIVYARYFAYAADPQLGAESRFQKAGVLEFQLRAPDGTPLNNFVGMQTSGAFDPTSDGNISHAVSCITQTKAGCPADFPDLHSQVLATGAVSGVIDYHHPVEPLTRESSVINSEGGALGPGESGAQVDAVDIVMTRRDYSQTGCSRGVYRNAGTLEWKVLERVSRFFTYPTDVGPHPVQVLENESISERMTYDKSLTLDSRSTQNLIDWGINPFKDSLVGDYDGQGNIVQIQDDLVSIRRLKDLGMATPPAIRKTLPITPFSNFQQVSGGGTLTGAGKDYAMSFSRSGLPRSDFSHSADFSFSVESKDLFSSMSIDDLTYAAHALVYVNGRLVHGGPYAGTTQLEVFRRVVSFPYDECRAVATNSYSCGNVTYEPRLVPQPDLCTENSPPSTGVTCTPQGSISVMEEVFTAKENISAISCNGTTCELFDQNSGKVEYQPGSFVEFSQPGSRVGQISILDLIQNGVNTISTRTLSAGGGFIQFNLKSTSCIETK